ncbi:MAG: MFS transporter [Bacillota bacterium]|nr:MFS transporter [Bacillota bacterium]
MPEFGVGIGDVQWVVTTYLVAMGVVIPATAYLADNFGTKRIFLAGVILFTLPPPLAVCSASPVHWCCWPRMPSKSDIRRTAGDQFHVYG